MLLFDATHTSHTRAQTGIQRVCRSLFAALEKRGRASGVCFDPHLGAWRVLDAGEQATLSDNTGGAGKSRGAKWSFTQKVKGHVRRLTGSRKKLPAADAVICPELFSGRVGARLPELFAATSGPRIAIFHDAIGLKFPELTPPGTVARLPAYLRELLQFDGVAAVSEDSAASLRDYWAWLGARETPAVTAIPLGLDEAQSHPGTTPHATPRVLCVGTIEGRKNHRSLLDAAELLWREGVKFELELIGLARADTAAAALARLRELQAAGRPLVYHGTVSEASLHAAYARCDFTVYPSLIEGFGLPVLESLRHGKPCICSAHGALGESTRGGGCAALDAVQPINLAGAMRQLLREPGELAVLAEAARRRKFRSWDDYASDLAAWMKAVSRRG